jgi:uncharacterized membrane protein
MARDFAGYLHLSAAVVALLAGAVIFFRRKGTIIHRALGYGYSAAMVTVLVTALFIYRLTHSFNILHFFAVISTPPLVIGLAVAILRRPGWLEWHYRWMSWSYVGLFAAFAAETATRVILPYAREQFGITSRSFFWTLVVGMSALVTLIGARLIRRNRGLARALEAKRLVRTQVARPRP